MISVKMCGNLAVILVSLTPLISKSAPSVNSVPYVEELGNGVTLKLVPIQAGEFDMGSPDTEVGRNKNEKLHHVKLTRPFFVGMYEITQKQYTTVMNQSPSHFPGENLPVEDISWEDATAFCRALSKKTGKVYRLPTEAEWEYACRAGTTTAFFFGDDSKSLGDYAWVSVNAKLVTHDVGGKQCNGWGLYDMQGNVWEWCSDLFSEFTSDAATDPTGPDRTSDGEHVVRGGSWNTAAKACRSAVRGKINPSPKSPKVGFRIVLEPSPVATLTGPTTLPADDRTFNALARARVEYEAAMQRVRDEVRKAMVRKADILSKAAKVDNAAVKAALDEEAGFESTGAWPEFPGAQQMRANALRASKEMLDAYTQAMVAYSKIGNTALRDAVRAESEQFERQTDIIAWSSNLVGQKPVTLTLDTIPFVLTLQPKADYRLEIVAKRSGDSGALIVGFPAGDEKSLAVIVPSSPTGEIRLMLSIRHGLIYADMGILRPLDSKNASVAGRRELTLRVVGRTTLSVESVRVKPIIDADVVLKPSGNSTAGSATPKTAADLMPVDSVWVGTVKHSIEGEFKTRLVVKKVTDNQIFLSGPWVRNDKSIQIVFEFSGQDLAVEDMRSKGAMRKEFDGGGKVEGNTVTCNFSWRINVDAVKNQKVTGSMVLQRE